MYACDDTDDVNAILFSFGVSLLTGWPFTALILSLLLVIYLDVRSS